MKSRTALQVVEYIAKYPLGTAFDIQQMLEEVCPDDCYRCHWKNLCCPIKEIERLNERGQ